MRSSADVNDAAVKGTADDAITGKLSAVTLGYFDDPFLVHFSKPAPGQPSRRPPIINRGNFARMACVDKVVRAFCGCEALSGDKQLLPPSHLPPPLAPSSPSTTIPPLETTPQVVSLGAGNDTTFFRLARDSAAPRGGYFEIDFPSTMERKLATLLRSPPLRQLAPLTQTQTLSQSDGDLRDANGVVRALLAAGLDPQAPTLLVAECVLVYMEPAESAALLAELSGNFPCRSVMRNNIRARGCRLPGFDPFPSLGAHVARLNAAGYSSAQALDMLTAYERVLDAAQVARAARIEPLDEVEEWTLIMSHYCLALAARGEQAEQFLQSLKLPAPLVRT
ncbi:S-adenosyl-L-methionine-dependent methyltransferase [Tribonema minus]|uniref:Leucine carboxyl methyltransferase 1 n=1 Tax=Tribonema minus TaxID=303371 RepID=A0A835YKC0_9STRA|nr:S-adenosyl-L-methionine-dependent methyltransferase [Tribonema minus]